MKFGAGGRIRTPDLLITNQLLYRLSYTSKPQQQDLSYQRDRVLSISFLKKIKFFEKGGMGMYHTYRRRRQIPLRCTLCGREIGWGEEYWACGVRRICGDCFPEFARGELAPWREIRGEEERA